MRRRPLFGLVTVGCLTLATTQADAGIIFSNLGPDDSFQSGYSIVSSGGTWAAPFTPASDTQLASVEVAFQHFSGSNSFIVQLLASDGSDGRPGTVLDSFALTAGSTPSIAAANSSLLPSLTGGTQYWIGIRHGAEDATGFWFFNDQGFEGFAGGEPAPPWSRFAYGGADSYALRVNDTPVGAAVPEPSSIALLGMGGLSLVGYGWRRRKTELSA